MLFRSEVVAEEEEEEEDSSDNAEDAEMSDGLGSTGRVSKHNMFQEEEEDQDVIDDDPDAPLGEPSDFHSMPLEFTSLSRAKPRELFKYAVEWMVHKKINPAFDSKDEIYTLTFKKLNDEVSGLANSKYSSSIWTPEFTRALRARPVATIDEIGKSLKEITLPHCEACNRKTHPATWNMCFTGQPYDMATLEPLADDDDDDTSSDSDADSSSSSSSTSALFVSSDSRETNNGKPPQYNAEGEILPPEFKVFTLGSTCKANAQMAHTLRHWRWHLNTWVLDYLNRMGHCTPEKLVERDNMSQRKREKIANKIVDFMETSGEIRKLHKLYKDQVDLALEANNEWNRGWGRR